MDYHKLTVKRRTSALTHFTPWEVQVFPIKSASLTLPVSVTQKDELSHFTPWEVQVFPIKSPSLTLPFSVTQKDEEKQFLQSVHSRDMSMIYRTQQSLLHLDEVVLKPNPLTGVQYLDLLIESEKNEARPGWKQQVGYYEEARRQAEILSKVKDVKTAQKNIEKNLAKEQDSMTDSSSGDFNGKVKGFTFLINTFLPCIEKLRFRNQVCRTILLGRCDFPD